MLDIRRKKVKAIYFNAFHCPECGLELHKDNIVLATYPPQYCYYCDCGFRTTSFQQPGYEYEFEDDDLPPAYPDKIKEIFMNQEPISDDLLTKFNNLGSCCIHTIDPVIVDVPTYGVSTTEAIENIKTVMETLCIK